MIVVLNNHEDCRDAPRASNPGDADARGASLQHFGPQSKNLGSVVRGIKSAVTKFANQNNIPFKWQSRFHDHIIRDNNDMNNIANYIINNPANWETDCFYGNN